MQELFIKCCRAVIISYPEKEKSEVLNLLFMQDLFQFSLSNPCCLFCLVIETRTSWVTTGPIHLKSHRCEYAMQIKRKECVNYFTASCQNISSCYVLGIKVCLSDMKHFWTNRTRISHNHNQARWLQLLEPMSNRICLLAVLLSCSLKGKKR